MPSILNATTTSGLVTSADNSGSLQLQTNNGTTAVTIDTSQNVGIGTASPTQKLDVNGTAKATTLQTATLNNTSGVLATQNGMTGIAKAWVNFNGSTAAINGSFNVSSITRNGTGDYTVNYTTAMPNSNYAISCTRPAQASNDVNRYLMIYATAGDATPFITTTSSRYISGYGSVISDANSLMVIVFSS